MTHRKFICVCACILLLLCLQGCTYYARPSSPSSEVLFCKDNYVPIMKYGFSGKRTAFRTQIELFGLSMDPVEDYNCMLNTDGTISDFVYNKDSQYYINQEYSKKIINNLNNGTYGLDLKQWYKSYNDLLRDGEYILEHFGFIRTPESGSCSFGSKTSFLKTYLRYLTGQPSLKGTTTSFTSRSTSQFPPGTARRSGVFNACGTTKSSFCTTSP